MALNVNRGTKGTTGDTVAGLRAVQRSGVTGALSDIATQEPGTWIQVWLDALFVFVVTRVLFLALTYLAPALLGTGPTRITALGALRAWVAQGAASFIHIAQLGYDTWGRTAFFPLFPLLEHLVAPVFGGNYGLAGFFVANASYLGALVLLRDLIGRDFEPDVARRTMLYLSIFPTAFFFFAPFSASLYLLLSIAAFAALRRRQWWLAGALGGLAVLADAQALVLLVPFAVELAAAVRYGLVRWWEILWAALIPAGLGVYAVYLAVRFRDPLALVHAQAYWLPGFAWPWERLMPSVRALAPGSKINAAALGPLLLALGAVAVVIVVATLLLRHLPRSYGLYAVALLLRVLLFAVPSGSGVPQDGGRLIGGLFPVFILAARWGRRPRLHEVLLIGEVAVLLLLALRFLIQGN